MMLLGRIYKDGPDYIAEVDVCGAITHGATRREAGEMLVDLLRTMSERSELQVTVSDHGKDGGILVSSIEPAALASLVLRYQRERHGLSLADVAAKLGSLGGNNYARYERGTTVPTIDKLDALLAAVAPELALALVARAPAKRSPRAKLRRRKPSGPS